MGQTSVRMGPVSPPAGAADLPVDSDDSRSGADLRIQVARGIMMVEPAMGTIDALAAGRDAFVRQAWTQAHTQLSAADQSRR